jgi:hypothetical protein
MTAGLSGSFVSVGSDCGDKEAVNFFIYFYLKRVNIEAYA